MTVDFIDYVPFLHKMLRKCELDGNMEWKSITV